MFSMVFAQLTFSFSGRKKKKIFSRINHGKKFWFLIWCGKRVKIREQINAKTKKIYDSETRRKNLYRETERERERVIFRVIKVNWISSA